MRIPQAYVQKMPQRPISLFEQLPYDIRAIIYGYLVPSSLPPFTRGFHSSVSGFILSCRSAKKDIEDIAAKNLTKYLTNFTSTLTEPINLKIRFSPVAENSTLAQLRQITVLVPFPGSDFLQHSDGIPIWKDKILPVLHLLLAQYLDKIHFRLCGAENRPVHETLLDRGRVEVKMHNLLRDVTYLIQRVNRDKTDCTTSESFMYVAEKQEETGSKPRVNTKRICLTWNLLGDDNTPESESVVLNGKLHRNSIRGISVVDETEDTAPLFYHLRDTQRLAGEMGIESARRWTFAGDSELIRLLNGYNTSYEYYSSCGPGNELSKGLVGVCAPDFEDCEEEVGKLIYK